MVQFVCWPFFGNTVIGRRAPTEENGDSTAFLVASRWFCTDAYAENVMDLSVPGFLQPFVDANVCIKKVEGTS
jgi:hypothetical protein